MRILEGKFPFLANKKASELWEINYDAVCWRVLTIEECLHIGVVIDDLNHSPGGAIC